VPKLLETIKCLDGECLHLDYHLQRLNTSRQKLGFHIPLEINLQPPEKGLYRCRLLYEENIKKVEYLPYSMKLPTSFKLVHSDINYELKYEDRTKLNNLLDDMDDVIIVKKGLITDTSTANVCFYNGKQWITPKSPLLHGTTRQRLLDEKKIHTADIAHTDIHKFSKIALMNAMIDFQIIENAIIS